MVHRIIPVKPSSATKIAEVERRHPRWANAGECSAPSRISCAPLPASTHGATGHRSGAPIQEVEKDTMKTATLPRAALAIGTPSGMRARALLSRAVTAYRQRRHYGELVRELQRYGDRDLADMGFARHDIPRIAREGAYGKPRAA